MDSSLKVLSANTINFKKEKKIAEGKEKLREVYRTAEDTLFVVNLLAATSHFLLFSSILSYHHCLLNK